LKKIGDLKFHGGCEYGRGGRGKMFSQKYLRWILVKLDCERLIENLRAPQRKIKLVYVQGPW
jgi:hypothetical protein